jgi:hypothetical protein
MNTRVLTGLALTGVIVLASCSQDQSPTTAAPREASFAKAAPTCSFSTANNDAKAYFALLKDPVYSLLDIMQSAYRAGGAAGATSAGFDVLARLGVAADAGSTLVKGTPALGNTFANDVLLCMGGPVIDFTNALGPAGLFAVRDGSVATAVVSRLIVSGAPAFGAEPSTGNWPIAGKTVFYANRLLATSFANETPAGTVFDIKTYPADLTFVPEIKTGVCTLTDPNGRILHKHAADPAVILPPAGTLSFCPTVSNNVAPTSMFAWAASQATSWLAPQPAYASTAMMPVGGGGAGLVGGLSEIGPVSYVSVVSFTQAPGNTSVSANPQFVPTVTVLNVTANGNALKGAVITLTVVGNNGSFNIVGNTATTDASGVATFPSLHIDKAGGYTVTATSELGGSAQTTFLINGQ